MGKRALFAFFLSLLVIMGYNYMLAQKYPPATDNSELEQQLEQQGQSNPALVAPEDSSADSFRPQQVPGASAFLDLLPSGSDKGIKDIVVETDLVRLVFTSSGARIKSCLLKDYPEEKISAEAVKKQISEIEQNLAAASAEMREQLLRQKRKQLILLQKIEAKPKMAEMISLAAAVDADFTPTILYTDNQEVNLALNTALYRCSNKGLTLSSEQPEGQIEFTFADKRGRKVRKIYTFSNANYGIGLDVEFIGWDKVSPTADYFLLFCGPDVGLPQAQRGRRTFGYHGPVTYFRSPQQGWTKREKYSRQEQALLIEREHTGEIGWAGLENKYFLSALIPLQTVQAVVVEKNNFGEQKVGLKVPWKSSGDYSFQLYLGPKKKERLSEIGVNLEKTIDYGFFSPIARLIYQILLFLSRWTNNFGWAIVLLCIITKIIFYPLTHRSFESMQKMQQQMKTVQPEMNALREKFKDNPQKLNKEIMELYRKRGINPLASCQSGCLPLLLQMPVFFALYAVLYNSIELRGTPFFGWIQDLSAKDPYYVLPILMGISMFVQQKLTGMGSAGGAQQDQAKMMGLLMPILLTWIFASLPSGVVLYWFTFNIATALQQLIIKKKQVVTTTS